MYLNHFKLHSKPFAMNPDPAFLYASPQHSAAFTMLEYAMESQAPFSLLTGEIGSGKTTLIRRLIRMLGDSVTVGLVSNTHDSFQSIHPWALSALGIIGADESDIGQYEALNHFFIREYGKRRRTLLIIDEAQNLSVPMLEELRLLSNINSEKDVALQIMLVGQPELRRHLQSQLKQFAQRVAVDFHLQALTSPEAEAYVRHRLAVAGGTEAIFDRQAISIIHEQSGGIPRLINQLCDLSLVYAFAAGTRQVNAKLVAEVVADRIRGQTSEPVRQLAEPEIAAARDIPTLPLPELDLQTQIVRAQHPRAAQIQPASKSTPAQSRPKLPKLSLNIGQSKPLVGELLQPESGPPPEEAGRRLSRDSVVQAGKQRPPPGRRWFFFS